MLYRVITASSQTIYYTNKGSYSIPCTANLLILQFCLHGKANTCCLIFIFEVYFIIIDVILLVKHMKILIIITNTIIAIIVEFIGSILILTTEAQLVPLLLQLIIDIISVNDITSWWY